MNALCRYVSLVITTLLSVSLAFATTAVITVQSPINDANVSSAVHYQATATSSDCPRGIAAMQVYSGPGVLVYATPGGALDTYISLTPGAYNTTVQAWDMCGGYAKANVPINVSSADPIDGYLYMTRSPGFCTPFLPSCPGNFQGYVEGYIVSNQGSLTATGQSAVKANQVPLSIAGDKGGYRLYVGDFLSGDVFAYFIDRRYGYLYPVPGSPFPANHSVTAVAVHPSGQFVFAARNERAPGDGVAVFRVSSDGSLAAVPGSPFPTDNGPWSMVVDPQGQYLYVIVAHDQIDAFSIDQVNGALTPLPGSPYPVPVRAPTCGGAGPNDIVNLGGKNVYTADEENNAIAAFSVSGAGTLSDVPGSPFLDNGGCTNPPTLVLTDENPRYLAIDGSGKYLYGLNQRLGDLSIFSINPDGTLSFVKNTAKLEGGSCQGPMATDATGDYLYVAACGGYPGVQDLSVAGFRINHDTGDLTPVPGSPFLTDPTYRSPNGADFLFGIAVTP